MRRVLLFLLTVAVFTALVPLAAVAASGEDALADSQGGVASVAENAQGNSVGNVRNDSGLDISLGLPKVTEQDALGKATRITEKIHGLATQVMPQITLVILVVGAILGIFLGEARRMVLFAIISLVVVLWAPFLVSLAISLLNS